MMFNRNLNRKAGFYWCKIGSGAKPPEETTKWVVLEYTGTCWNHKGGAYYDEAIKQIDERKLVRNEK